MEPAERDISVSVLVLNESNQVLLVLNREEEKVLSSGKRFSRLSMWGLPTGRGEPEDEDEIDTGRRETEEETGLWVDINPRLRIEEPREDHLKIAFIGYPVTGQLRPHSEEIIDVGWFPIRVLYDQNFKDDKYGKGIYPSHQRRAQELLQLRRKLRSRSHGLSFQKEN